MGCCGNCEGEEKPFMDRSPGSIKAVNPPNYGWLEYNLHEDQIEYIWKCIENKGTSIKNTLVGDISDSFQLKDEEDKLLYSTIFPLIITYRRKYGQHFDSGLPIESAKFNWWVNYQKEGEYNPLHCHNGVYSFVIWMKIPTESKEQNKDSPSGTRSNFYFTYLTATGDIDKYEYTMSSNLEGCMLFFPSKMSHMVHPFYNCSEDRISVSGNIFFN